MKRSVINFFVFCLISLFTNFLYAEYATITYVRGKVEILREDGNWYKLNVGDQISQNETISTGFSSEAKIEYKDSIMTLGAVTRCCLENLSSAVEKDSVSVFLSTGAVRSKVNHSKDKRVSYVVKTPVAVASVRGTDFTILANGELTCNEGAVVIFPNTESNLMYINNSTVSSESSEQEIDEEINSEEKNLDSNLGDYGPANALTSAKDISQDAPIGAIVVGKNQTVTITSLGTTETPINNAIKKSTQAKSVVSVPSDTEAEVIGASVDTPITDTTNIIEDLLLQKVDFIVEVEVVD